MTDEITVTVPHDPGFHRVAHLVLGGLAVRLDLTFENLEDLELGLDTLLEREPGDGEITVTHRITDDAVQTSVGPFQSKRLRAELEGGKEQALGLGRILRAVADDVHLVERDDGQWVELTKRVQIRRERRR
jgi:hypothetical protein